MIQILTSSSSSSQEPRFLAIKHQMPILSPPTYFAHVRGQPNQHSDHCDCSTRAFGHDGNCPCAPNPVRKYIGLKPLSMRNVKLSQFQEVLAAHRFLTIQFPDTPPDASMVDKYITPVLWFHERFINKGENSAPPLWRVLAPMSTGVVCAVRIDHSDDTHLEPTNSFCIILFMSPGTVCWKDFIASDDYFQCSYNYHLSELVRNILEDAQCWSVLVTDESHAVIIDSINLEPIPSPFVCYNHFCLSAGPSLRFIIGTVLYSIHRRSHYPAPYPRFVHGVLNHSTDLQIPIARPEYSPSSYRDFDIYTLQRSLPNLKKFLRWHEEISSKLQSHPLAAGNTLTITRNGFLRDKSFWRSCFPIQPLSDISRQYVLRQPRTRDDFTDRMLSAEPDSPLSFRISEVSFVEGMFPFMKEKYHWLSQYDEESWGYVENPSSRLQTLNFADDMIRREEFVYNRLREYQGTLIPHYYGAHLFTADNYPSSYGILMEATPGITLDNIPISTWPRDRQIGLTRHLRHCVKPLLYAGIDQQDFHDKQLLFPRGEDYDPDKDSIVFLDFAFAVPRLGDEQVTGVAAPMSRASWTRLSDLLLESGVGVDILVGSHAQWHPQDLEEI
ncbi:hypothetical protein ABKN59_001787 [Abortiporus biennis]